MEELATRTQNGRFSPLRYPGGKGKISRFIESIVRLNGLSDGRYVEPYAGGAAIAWELLLTGVVRRVSINDISRPIYSFWNAVLYDTDRLCSTIEETDVSVETWQRYKYIYKNQMSYSDFEVAFAFFFLNRTNRSGILNGGMIGGKNQLGLWKIDARYNKLELVKRIQKIASLRNRIEISNLDAIEFIKLKENEWRTKTLVYVDPPYYEKGRYLYHDAYRPDDHREVGEYIKSLDCVSWIVSYDDVRPIHEIYEENNWLQYTLNYSARNVIRGREAMFFSRNLVVPEVVKPLIEIDREFGEIKRPAQTRYFE